MSMVGYAVVYVLKNARKLKYLKVISLVVFLRFALKTVKFEV